MSGFFGFMRSKPACDQSSGGLQNGPLYGVEYSAVWRRLAAGLTDAFIILVLSMALQVVALLISQALAAVGPHPLHEATDPPPGFDEIALVIALGLTFLLGWLYFALFESGEMQATPGKRLLRITVGDLFAQQITFKRASVRWLIGVGLFLVPPILLLPLVTSKRQGLHDAATRTIVAAD